MNLAGSGMEGVKQGRLGIVATGKKQPMVQFKGIMKRFGNVVAVEKMDFDI